MHTFVSFFFSIRTLYNISPLFVVVFLRTLLFYITCDELVSSRNRTFVTSFIDRRHVDRTVIHVTWYLAGRGAYVLLNWCCASLRAGPSIINTE